MKELEIIQELMEELKNKMAYDESDFKERLGREDGPEVKVLKIEGMGMDPLQKEQDMGDMEEDMYMDDETMMPMDPKDAMLKKRLMKLRA